MLFGFFLRRFLYNFSFFFVVVTAILGAGNAFVKFSLISCWGDFLFVFLALVPFMAIFAIPLVSGLAVHVTVGNLMVNDELLLVQFFSSAHRTLWTAALVFALMMVTLFVPLTFYWAPQSYWAGKRALLQVAKKQFNQFEPGKFHTPFAGVTFFFKQKHVEKNIPHYDMLFLAFNGKHGERYFFTAKQGLLNNNCLYLLHGSIYTVAVGKHYFATFEQTEVNLSKIFDLEKDLLQGHQAKFLSMDELWKTRKNQEADYEFHKRLAQILWLFLFPFLALMNVLSRGGRKSNLLLSVAFNGLLFLISYISLSLAHVLWAQFWLALALMYGTMGLVVALGFSSFSPARAAFEHVVNRSKK